MRALLPLLLLAACAGRDETADGGAAPASRTVEQAVADVEAARAEAAEPPPAAAPQAAR